MTIFESLSSIDNEIFTKLAEQICNKPSIAKVVINNMAKVALKFDANQIVCLNVLLNLCISSNKAIRDIAIKTSMTTYYTKKGFAEIMEEFSINSLCDAAKQEEVQRANQYMQYYFSVMEYNGKLLPHLLDVYGMMSKDIKNEV